MRSTGPVLLALMVLASTGAVAAEREEFEKAARTILCDCGCHPQSVYDCACGRAEVMRNEILARVRAGKTGLEIIDEYVERGGEQVRIAPTARGFNLFAWLGPGAAFLIGVLGVIVVLRRWRRTPPLPSPGPIATAGEVDERYLARLEQEIRDTE